MNAPQRVDRIRRRDRKRSVYRNVVATAVITVSLGLLLWGLSISLRSRSNGVAAQATELCRNGAG